MDCLQVKKGPSNVFSFLCYGRKTDSCTEAATCTPKAEGAGQRGGKLYASPASRLVNMFSLNNLMIFHHATFQEFLVNVVDEIFGDTQWKDGWMQSNQ